MADPSPPGASDTPNPNTPRDLTDDELRAICDPEIEMCKEIGVPFANTIELDYKTPNLYIGLLSIAEFLVPYFI